MQDALNAQGVARPPAGFPAPLLVSVRMPPAPLALLPARRILPIFARGEIALPLAAPFISQPW